MVTTSYGQSFTRFFTWRTILAAVIVGPEGISRRSFCPLARTLTWVPPTSTTRTLRGFLADFARAGAGADSAGSEPAGCCIPDSGFVISELVFMKSVHFLYL